MISLQRRLEFITLSLNYMYKSIVSSFHYITNLIPNFSHTVIGYRHFILIFLVFSLYYHYYYCHLHVFIVLVIFLQLVNLIIFLHTFDIALLFSFLVKLRNFVLILIVVYYSLYLSTN